LAVELSAYAPAERAKTAWNQQKQLAPHNRVGMIQGLSLRFDNDRRYCPGRLAAVAEKSVTVFSDFF